MDRLLWKPHNQRGLRIRGLWVAALAPFRGAFPLGPFSAQDCSGIHTSPNYILGCRPQQVNYSISLQCVDGTGVSDMYGCVDGTGVSDMYGCVDGTGVSDMCGCVDGTVYQI